MSIPSKDESPLAPLIGVVPFVVGILVLALVTGGKILAPGNLGWLQHGDAAQHYLGWAFFRSTAWTIPLGLNPAYGLEMASSIVYADSIPLLAIFFKLFDRILPADFQYFGIWVLACIVLQAWFGFRLARLMTDDAMSRSLVCVLFAIAPPMLFRLGGHLALMGHFLILAALYGSFRRDVRWGAGAWAVLVTVAALVHAYLMVMVLAVWSAALLDRTWCREMTLKRAVMEAVIVSSVLALVCWQAGYFAVDGGTGAWGYGFYRMNLLSPVDPDTWSRVLPDLPGGEGDGEGFGYLGMGSLLLLVIGAYGMATRRPAIRQVLRRHRALAFTAAMMVVYAWSDQIGLGSYRVELGYAGWLGGAQDVFRASGRFLWPAYYLVMLAAVGAVVVSFRKPQARWILAICLLLQVYDTSAGWRLFGAYRAEPTATWNTALVGDFWLAVGGHYERLRGIPPANRPDGWRDFAALAASQGLATDMVYLARIDESGLAVQQARVEAMLDGGGFDPGTIYVLDDASVARARAVLGERDALARLDGFNVLLPGGRDCAPCMATAGDSIETATGTAFRTWTFAEGRHRELLVAGWSESESWGVWSEGGRALVQLPEVPAGTVDIVFSGYAYGPNAGADIHVHLGGRSGVVRLGGTPGQASLQLPNPDGASLLELIVPTPTSPLSLGQGEDPRPLGIALTQLAVRGSSTQSR